MVQDLQKPYNELEQFANGIQERQNELFEVIWRARTLSRV